ncbi:MAG: hypothetical protein CL943_01380 [Candidatus Diapherotrites archaeon]|uniref:DUF3267 domain-containing protein n=1 Tax=Candidatus Iainarchaeum sp. TaxID=3101447 RepID=A0A2D6M0I4_9ARCH|nr:hypothetical protein [Candidatus Diapherotrites archaeon]|tara:strand:+ start:3569 stop:4126 length:558 start_codon:yes stop_codon:yes gene_type:complete
MLFKLMFPGVIFHELAHYLACMLVGVKVYSVKLFDSKEAFVQHANPTTPQAIVISLAPFALNNVLGIWLLFFANELLLFYNPISLFFYWLAISLLFQSFPSDTDAMNSFTAARHALTKRLKHGKPLTRAAWLILSPIIFLPVLFLTGLLLVFDKSTFLKVLWLIAILLLSFDPGTAIAAINNFFI